MKMTKRILSLVLCFVMLVGLMPNLAFAAEGEPVVVIAGSDYQDSGSATTMQNIGTQIKDDHNSIFGILMGGDYDAGTVYPNASHLTAVDNTISSVFPSIVAENRIMIQGNHETYGDLSPDTNSLLDATGGYETDHYSVYAINYEDFGSAASGLKTYLDGKSGYTKPIFVLSHQPLHKTNRGDNNAAVNLFNVLNNYEKLNIIFLFGHNHSSNYDAYLGGGSIYLKKGDSIQVAGGSTSTLNFTYMNYGYVGYSRSGADDALTMTAFEIYEDEVIIKRYDANGLHNLKAAGVSANGYTADTNVYGSAVLSLANGTSTIKTLAETEGGSGDDNTGSGDDNTGSGDNSGTTGGSGNVYKLDTDGVTTGEDYLIVSAGADGTAQALRNNNGTVSGAEVTISNGQIVTDAEDIVWTYDDSKYISNNGEYIYLTYNNSISFDADEPRAMAITSNNAGEGAYTVKRDGDSYNYYLNYSNGSWTCGGSADDIYFFVRTSETGSGGTTGGGSAVTPEGGDWVTITKPVEASSRYKYQLDTDGTVDTGVEYLIVDNEEALALSAAASSNNTLAVELDGNYAYTDSEDYGWVFTKSGSNYTIRLNGTTYLGRSSGNLTTGSANNTWTVSHNSGGEYYVKVNGSNRYLRYTSNGSIFQAGSTQTPVRLYKYVGQEDIQAQAGLYAKLDGELTYTVPYGASTEKALEVVMAGINVLTSASADGSNPTTLDDSNADIKWELASGYNGTVPGEYAVTISYKGVKLGTAKVIVPNVGIEAEDVLYYIDDTLTAPVGQTLVEGTPANGTYGFEILGGDAIITSIDPDGTIHFGGTEGTAQVKITYTYADGDTTATLEKTINVTAKAPYFGVEICDPETNEPITGTIALKGVEANDTRNFIAVVKEYNAEYPDGNPVENPSLMWTVSNTSIATIAADGTLTFTGTSFGTFDVSVYYLDEKGDPICEDAVTVSASKLQYVIPEDGTDDFPEYPEQGAVRFDKTAVAQGNFSASGIAKVELSMTGVPYGSSVPTDVVIMVDMTTSMYHYGYIDDADAAIKNMLEALVYDAENNKFDPNIYVQVWSFKSDDDGENVAFVENLSRRNITSPEALEAAQSAIKFDTEGNDGSGTCYDEGTKKMYEIVQSCTTENVVAVFASDGGPSRYTYLNANGGASEVSGSNASVGQDSWFNSNGSVTDDYKTEYYTYLLKTQKNPVPVYTIGVGIDADTPEAHILEHMSSEYNALGTTVSTAPDNATTDYFALADINTTPDALSTIFEGIAASIREAATDVVVEDKIDSHYTMNFSLPSGVTAAEAGMENFYIQVLGYELDEHNDRKPDPTVLEKFLFGSTISHTVAGVACGETCTHVTKTGDKITGIDGTYFDYTVDANDDEFLTWTAEKLDRTELALEYFVYLDHSAGEENAADQVEPGTYPTNEHATITYKNFNGKECQQNFPVPTMTWMGAKVTYVFYLVNEDGQPVNRAGKVIPFAEAIFVTDPVTYDVTWNEEEGIEKLSAEYLAKDKVPDVYSLYDDKAYYEILVYQNEGVDNTTNAKNYNHFIIEGSSSVGNKETTKVYNTKAGTRFDTYGAYSATAGSYTSTESGTTYTATVTNGIDYANTTVAFAVVWKPELKPDTVVVDYGLDVVIDVTTNDALASGVTGVSTTAPADVEANKGTYRNSAMDKTADIIIGDLVIGTAKLENLNAVRFSLNKVNGMQFKESIEFFYESECNYYTYDGEDRTLNTAFMYSKVTVIPATTIYYEDTFVTLTSYTKVDDVYVKDEQTAWAVEGTNISSVQQQDRPGASQISAALDADNNYGYDAAYKNMSTYSMGAARKIHLTPGHDGQADFDFYGTGFDVISMTSNKTGTIVVEVYPYTESGSYESVEPIKSLVVDTYYGYAYGPFKQTFTYTDGEWVMTEERVDALGESEDVPTDPKEGTTYVVYENKWYTVDSNDPAALYQVPVMKISGLTYGRYHAKIVAFYDEFFDNTGDSAYDFYLDAIRIYDPTGNQNDVANDAYVQDGEGWPTYEEVRNYVIDANTFNSLTNDEEISGIVFIDSNTTGSPAPSIADYTSFGPNNELYLAPGQAITFTMTPGTNVAKIQMAMKTVGGTGKVQVYTVENGEKGDVILSETLSSATDMYYTIWEKEDQEDTAPASMTLVIKNNGDEGAAIISITNVKITHTSAPATRMMMFAVRRPAVEEALATLSVEEDVTEPETQPTEPETEVTEPETEATEPETEVTEPETEPTEPETEATEPETEPTEPETEPSKPSPEEQVEEVIRVVKKIIKGFLGWLFG